MLSDTSPAPCETPEGSHGGSTMSRYCSASGDDAQRTAGTDCCNFTGCTAFSQPYASRSAYEQPLPPSDKNLIETIPSNGSSNHVVLGTSCSTTVRLSKPQPHYAPFALHIPKSVPARLSQHANELARSNSREKMDTRLTPTGEKSSARLLEHEDRISPAEGRDACPDRHLSEEPDPTLRYTATENGIPAVTGELAHSVLSHNDRLRMAMDNKRIYAPPETTYIPSYFFLPSLGHVLYDVNAVPTFEGELKFNRVEPYRTHALSVSRCTSESAANPSRSAPCFKKTRNWMCC